MSSKPGVLNDPRREDFRAAILKSVPHLDSPAVQYAVSAAARELGLFSSRTSVRVAASMVRQPFFTSVYFPKATLWTLTFLKMNSFMAGSSFIGVFRALQVLE